MRDAGLTERWDLQGSPDATRNLYEQVSRSRSTGLDDSGGHVVIDCRLLQHSDSNVAPLHTSTSYQVVLTSDEENPFGHDMSLG